MDRVNLILRSYRRVIFALTLRLYFMQSPSGPACPPLYRYYRKRIVSPYSIYLKSSTPTGRYYHNRPHPDMQIYLDGAYAPVTQTNLIYRPDGIRWGVGRTGIGRPNFSDPPRARRVGARLRNRPVSSRGPLATSSHRLLARSLRAVCGSTSGVPE